MSQVTLWMCDQRGALLDVFDESIISSLSYALVENEINAVEVVLPQLWPWEYFDVDQIMLVQLDVGQGPYIDANRAYFLTDWDYYSDENNMQWIRLTGVDGNDLLNRRIVAYAAETSQAKKTDQYDDIIKLIAAENLGSSATDTARSLASYVTIAPGKGAAPTATDFEMQYKNVFNVCQDCADGSLEGGTYLVFDMSYTGAGKFRLDTYTGWRGVDHSLDGNNPRYVQIARPVMSRKHSDEANYIYCGGKGEGEARDIVEAYGNDYKRSIWARREKFADARSADTEDGVTEKAKAALKKNRFKTTIEGELLDGDGFQYGIDYEWGDIVGVSYNGQAFSCHLTAVEVTFEGGVRTIRAVLRGEQD